MSFETSSQPAGLPHAVFLQRVADEPATSPEVRLGQGAFLALRFVDLLSPERDPPAPDVFRYQWAATERYCAELAGEGTEAAHLSGIVRATGEAHRVHEVRLLAPALLAYALYLEQESHLEEADDVLQTLVRTGAGSVPASDVIGVWLRVGRVRRKQADFNGATLAYREAGRLAEIVADREALLRSRIGLCNVKYFQGNLAEAEGDWRAVLADAALSNYRDLEAHAEHGLGTVLQRRGQPHEGAPHLWRAYELHQDDGDRLRALGDLGALLVTVGDVKDAQRALEEVVRRGTVAELVANAAIELMQCASFRRDRVSFERWREQALQQLEHAPANIRADYYLKAGIGFARFGNFRKGESHIRQALEIATAHELHELTFRIERIQSGLRNCDELDKVEHQVPEPAAAASALRVVSASLAALGS